MGFGQPVQAQTPYFPAYLAFEDSVIQIGYDFRREGSNTHIITAYYKNKTGVSLSNVNMQVAA